LTRALALVGFVGTLLAVDTQVGARAQLLLGLAAWIALAAALRGVSPALRAQALVVVPVATCAEVLGSVIWGVYTYRLENLPTFVPPCHGLVYLAGAAIAGAAGDTVSRARLVRVALAAVLGWGLLGVTVLPRTDVAGALGAALLAYFHLRGRLPRRRLARALRHRARHLGLGGGDPRHGHPAGQSAERRRLRLRVVRRRRARGRAAPARARPAGAAASRDRLTLSGSRS
jgi:hypothetical protein